jgi:hypothetical protein
MYDEEFGGYFEIGITSILLVLVALPLLILASPIALLGWIIARIAGWWGNRG